MKALSSRRFTVFSFGVSWYIYSSAVDEMTPCPEPPPDPLEPNEVVNPLVSMFAAPILVTLFAKEVLAKVMVGAVLMETG